MFSGIIEKLCRVTEVKEGEEVIHLLVNLEELADGVCIGDSIAVNGTCLTVTELNETVSRFDVVPETLDKTNLGGLSASSRVNIERSLKIGDRLHGHFVQGHVDGVGTISDVQRNEEGGVITIEASRELLDQMIYKGSISVDGISLTIASLEASDFSIALIPHTLSMTTLGVKNAGDKVNLEVDMIGKWVRRLLPGQEANARSEGVTMELLKAGGFT
ncbi:MAG: riboflavin synthase [Planctomycetota bacterium]|nr:riboflavin synthase [Planctomycetota bacterium]MDA1140590.1 riboflavin synthase [Planctomycetota bacterium]